MDDFSAREPLAKRVRKAPNIQFVEGGRFRAGILKILTASGAVARCPGISDPCPW